MFASVIIPAFNRPEYLSLTLAGLARQTAPPDWFEVIIVNDGTLSISTAVDVLREFAPDIRYTVVDRQPKGSRSGARNLGAQEARGDVFVFLDQDMIPWPGLVESHLAAFARGHDVVQTARAHRAYTIAYSLDDIDRATLMRCHNPNLQRLARRRWLHGPLLTPEDVVSGSAALERLTHRVFVPTLGDAAVKRRFDLMWPKWPHSASSNIGYTRRLFCSIGGFDHNFDHGYGLEDAELGYRAEACGASITVSVEAVAAHQYHPRDRDAELEGTLRNWRVFLSKHDTVDVWLWMSMRVLREMTFTQYLSLVRRHAAGDAAAVADVDARVKSLASLTLDDLRRRRGLAAGSRGRAADA